MTHIVVAGGGFAGTAAAFAARRLGADVTLIGGGAGASALYAGAADDDPWDDLERAAAIMGAPLSAPALEDDVAAFARTLALWSVPEAGAPLPRIVTTAGIVRTTRAHDIALLELGALRGRTVLVPRADRAGWDADSLVRCLSATTAETGVSFETISSPILRFEEEGDIVDVDLAARHDDDGRLDWVAKNLRVEIERRGAASTAVLLGPWLGSSRSRAEDLAKRIGVPCGEALAATAGTAGQRFEVRRAALLSELSVRVVRGWIRTVGVKKRGHGVEVTVGAAPPSSAVSAKSAEAPSSSAPLVCDALVLATGGLIGGGLRYEPPEFGASAEGAKKMRPPFSSNPPIDGVRVTDGTDTGLVSSALGPTIDERAWPLGSISGVLERVGVLTARDGRAAPGIYAAGDLTAGRRRTVLATIRSGLAAGRGATEHALDARTKVGEARSS